MTKIWFAPAPARHLAYLRISAGGFALGYLIVRTPHLLSFGSYDSARFEPVGVVGTLLGAPLSQTAVTAVLVVTIALGFCFVSGIGFRFLGPAFALGLLWVTSYRNSFGTVLHTENLFVLHVAILSLTAAADAHSLDARRRIARGQSPALADLRYRWPVASLVLLTGIAYLIAGVAKLESAGAHWLSGEPLQRHLAYDNLRKLLLGDYSSPVIGFFLQFAWIWGPIAVFTILVELGAPLAVLGRRLAIAFAVCLWSFHVGVVVLMAIVFPYQVLGLAFIPYLLIGAAVQNPDQRPSNFASRFSIKAMAASRKSSVPSNGNIPVN